MLRIDLASLWQGVHHIDLHPEAETLDLDPATFSDIRVDVVLDYHNDRALVTLQATATATLECDRTLVDFEQPLDGTYRLLYVPPSFARRAKEDEDIEEIRVLDPSDPVLDLTDAVRDTLLLAVPARKVAPGAEDTEIPTVFGEADEPDIDPRWEALRKLQASNGNTDS